MMILYLIVRNTKQVKLMEKQPINAFCAKLDMEKLELQKLLQICLIWMTKIKVNNVKELLILQMRLRILVWIIVSFLKVTISVRNVRKVRNKNIW